MNVKPGDLAKVVGTENEGARVSVLSAAGCGYEDADVDWEVMVMSAVDGHTLDGERVPLSPGMRCGMQDKHLRRIDPDGEDEMLTLTGLPNCEAVT